MQKILIYEASNVRQNKFLTGVRILDEQQWLNILQKIIRKISNFSGIASGSHYQKQLRERTNEIKKQLIKSR